MNWDFFYEGCNTIGPWTPAKLLSVTTPVNNDRAWQINARNEVNYDTSVAFDASVLLERDGSDSCKPARRFATGVATEFPRQ